VEHRLLVCENNVSEGLAPINVEVSVAMAVCGAEEYIHPCIESLLTQTFKKFEIVIVEDPPFDKTKEIVDKFKDERIVYVRNREYAGLSKSRNRCVKLARARYVFFTDADCIASNNWIERGLKSLRDHNTIGVEGKTYYVSEDYQPTYSDGIVENRYGGQFMTCNIAYKKSIIDAIGGFDERYTYMEDRDLALRASKFGKIRFDAAMVVYHQKITLEPLQFVKQAKRVRNRVLLYKKLGEKVFFLWRILYPTNLLAIIFPPLTVKSLFSNRYRGKKDFALFPFIYVKLIYERLTFWDMCARERVFLI
jgi:GT2 family glycosyltransferase